MTKLGKDKPVSYLKEKNELKKKSFNRHKVNHRFDTKTEDIDM